MTRERDRKTGRYVHIWGWQGYDLNGDQWENCQHCDKWMNTRTGRATSKGPAITYNDGTVDSGVVWQGAL